MCRLVLVLAGLLLLAVPGATAAAPGGASTDIPRVRVAIDSASQENAGIQRELITDARSLIPVIGLLEGVVGWAANPGVMDPRARPFAAGTVERMDELLAGDLALRSREWVQCVRLGDGAHRA